MHKAIRRAHPASVPAVQSRELWSWAMFDFANSGYTTVVITAVFNAYFVGVIAAGADWGTLVWTLALSASYLLIMLSAPLLGAWADLRARKKSVLVASTLTCVAGTAALAWCGPGSLWLAVLLIVISNTAYGTGENVIAAFLPELAHEDAMGRLSGYGWALGYVGGLLVLGLCLWWITGAEARGASTDEAVAQSMLITAAAFLLAALPTLLLLRERAVAQTLPAGAVSREAWARVRGAIAGSAGLLDLRRFLWCIVSYQAGVATVITIAAIFTSEALGFTTEESIQLILLVNITAAIGALCFGWVQDRLGHRPTLAISLLGWLLAIALFFVADDRALIWVAANVAGFCLGASQSAGRGLVGYLCPAHREAEIFGLWGLAVKLAMIVGPVSYGLVSWLSGNDHRLAMLSTTGYFVLGLLLLLRVDVARGRRAVIAQAPMPG